MKSEVELLNKRIELKKSKKEYMKKGFISRPTIHNFHEICGAIKIIDWMLGEKG